MRSPGSLSRMVSTQRFPQRQTGYFTGNHAGNKNKRAGVLIGSVEKEMISAAQPAMKKGVASMRERKIADIPYIYSSVIDCKPYC